MTSRVKISDFCSVDEQVYRGGGDEWSVARLIELSKNLPVMEVPLKHLNIYYLFGDMTLRELVTHMKAVQKADLNYPIILNRDGEIMDGRHRVMKALLEERETIKAVRFEEDPHPCRYYKGD